MNPNYTTLQRYRGGKGRRGRMAFARVVEDVVDGVGLLPETALVMDLQGPLISQPMQIRLVPVSASRFQAVTQSGEVVAEGGVMAVFTALGRRMSSRFAVRGEG